MLPKHRSSAAPPIMLPASPSLGANASWRSKTSTTTNTYTANEASLAPFSTLAHRLGLLQHAPRRLRTLVPLLLLLLALLALVDRSLDVNDNGLGYLWVLPKIHDIANKTDPATHSQADFDNTPKPLTDLGWEADLVYGNVGSTDPDEYRRDLEDFLHRAFPASDSNTTDPDSLLSVLHHFLPPPLVPYVPPPQQALQQLYLLPFQYLRHAVSELIYGPPPPPVIPHHAIPERVYQTSWQPGPDPPNNKPWPASWRGKNPNTPYQYFDNPAAATFIDERFNHSLTTKDGRGGIADTYHVMSKVPVMQSDFWRYAILASEGGIYSDLDTVCLKPISQWHRNPWIQNQADPQALPSLIVGVEQDVGSRRDWHQWWPRPLGLVQWTIAGARGHPVLIDVLRRVSEVVNPHNASLAQTVYEMGEAMHRNLDAVVEQTGPGPWTDSVLRCECGGRTPFPSRLPDKHLR